jgi:predicted enzyme related to lactoylglutathione lyase
MPEYAPGVPLWVDVSSPDMDRTRAFYSGLFGWEAQVIPDPEAGGYTFFTLDGQSVGAAGPTTGPHQHPAWTTYVCSADADATARAVKEAGGEVVMEPMDVFDQGRMAVFRDPTGAHVSIWQPGQFAGAGRVNDPGSFCWNELYTRDMPAAREFYGKVFGWEVEESEFSGGAYTVFKLDGRPIAGGLDMSTMLPEHVPPHWLVYFTVEDTEGTAARARELGATILAGPQPTPMGPMAVINDPVEAAFAIIQASAQS